ncbi:hypothetical protein PFTANZ_00667 [Plasmodium falciparum Tanzania (2000708)]|uniref:Uncharacterized protein n=2 Tax=Plasmodium falciparum TaxID=5833 RepID=A0A024WDZ4_PLAFA|nr:hypothetical protein PFTANZ_00667 [Plasmodium falciparum Tanzania (2000708)]ETW45032.1 hypothetical protein PFNF135_00633 [Plasmodium falciparum NF135/5.C10]
MNFLCSCYHINIRCNHFRNMLLIKKKKKKKNCSILIIVRFSLLVSFFLKFASNVYVENRESQIIFYNILLSTHKKKKNKLIFLFLK